MEGNIGRIWLALPVLAMAVVVFFAGDSLKPIGTKKGEAPFLTALTQLGILYFVALFVERSLEVLIKAWRQGGKSLLQEEVRSAEEGTKAEAEKALEDYKTGTQRRALLVGLTLGILVSVSGVRLLGPIFEFGAADAWSFQQAVFQFTDIIVTAGLIAGGSATIHKLMALVDDFLRKSRTRAKHSSSRQASDDATKYGPASGVQRDVWHLDEGGNSGGAPGVRVRRAARYRGRHGSNRAHGAVPGIPSDTAAQAQALGSTPSSVRLDRTFPRPPPRFSSGEALGTHGRCSPPPPRLEQELQDSIEEAPWLVNPLWSPITSNQQLSTLKSEFEKFFETETGSRIRLEPFEKDAERRRPDFVLSADDFGLQIIEIKRPRHKLNNEEWDRVQRYIDQMGRFLDLQGHEEFKRIFRRFTVTLVCEEIGLSGSQLRAFTSYRDDRTVEHITWGGFLRRTEHMHQEFLAEAERQKQLAVSK